MRIPFDAFALSSIVEEMRNFLNGKVQRIVQPQSNELVVSIYGGPGLGEASFLISAHPDFARTHFVTRRYSGAASEPSAFVSTLRARLMGARLEDVVQVEQDRIVEWHFEGDQGSHRLIAELMGKHSNVMLVAGEGKVVTAMKWVPRAKSSRPIVSGNKYHRPPVLNSARPFWGSPFLKKLVEAGASETGEKSFVYSPGHGAYPLSVTALGLPEHTRKTLSIALEQHYDLAIPQAEAERLRQRLIKELERVALSREVALHDLNQALETGNRATEIQQTGELILAYGSGIPEGTSVLEAWDYSGVPVSIRLDPTLTFQQNADRYFSKARKAKDGLGMVREQISRLQNDWNAVRALSVKVEQANSLQELEDLDSEAKKNRWTNVQTVQSAKKDERPHQGLKVREILGPGGVNILYGENAEANDYLTLRVARPNDWWLHIRGSTSAHVVVQTGNKPERISQEALLYAAKVAVSHSPMKHSQYVAVDYTLKKYVRKPRGAARGTALYTHEKTLHVDSI